MKLKSWHYPLLFLLAIPLLPLAPAVIFWLLISRHRTTYFDSQIQRWNYQLTGAVPNPSKRWSMENINALSRYEGTPWAALMVFSSFPAVLSASLLSIIFKSEGAQTLICFLILPVFYAANLCVYYFSVKRRVSELWLYGVFAFQVILYFILLLWPKTGVSDVVWVTVFFLIPSASAVHTLIRLVVAARPVYDKSGEVPMGNVSRTFPHGKKHW